MSRQSIRRQIEHYGKLKSNAEKELKKLEEELELLNVFRRKYISAKSDLDYNITHRNKRLTDTELALVNNMLYIKSITDEGNTGQTLESVIKKLENKGVEKLDDPQRFS